LFNKIQLVIILKVLRPRLANVNIKKKEIKTIKVITDVEKTMPFAKFSNNSRLITFFPQLKDLGEYHSSLNLKNIIIGDVKETSIKVLVIDPTPG
jgi:hypothetical protein